MKTPLTFLLSLTFLFLFPSVSFSKSFRCEFLQEKQKGGKNNKVSCSMKPKKMNWISPKHCTEQTEMVGFDDFRDFIVDLDKKMITYDRVFGTTPHGLDDMVLYHKKKGDKESESEIRKRYSESDVNKKSAEIVSVKTFSQRTTMSHLITYKWVSSFSRGRERVKDESFSTLYIPANGESIISMYVTGVGMSVDSPSVIAIRFGKCVNTSN